MISHSVFSGERPLIEPHLLSEDQATFCLDCYLITGGIDPLRGGKLVRSGVSGAKTLYKVDDKIISMAQWTDFVRSPVVEDSFDRIYFTPRTGGLRKTTYGGLVNNVTGVDLFGIQYPSAAPVATVTSNGNDDQLSSTRFLVTHVSNEGEETGPVFIGNTIDYEDGIDDVTVSIPTAANMQFTRVYMEIAGEWIIVSELPATQGSVTYAPLDDDLAQSQTFNNSVLGATLLTENFAPPVAGLIGLKGLPNGSLAAFTNDGVGQVDGTVHISYPYQPHAWPIDYRFPIKYEIEALEPVPEGLLVLTQGRHSIITGSTPDVMDEHVLETHHSCLDYRSVVNMGDVVFWSSPDGIAMYGGRQIRIVSKDVFTREQWQSLTPDNMIFGIYESRIIIYPQVSSDMYGDAGLIYNIERNDVTRISRGQIHALLYDVEDDALFIADGDNLERFNEGEYLQGEWISKTHIVPAAKTHSSMRIIPEGETEVSLYRSDNDLGRADQKKESFWQKLIAHQRPFRIKSMGRMRSFRVGFKLIGRKRMRMAQIAQDMREIY